jgi:hypothetical protein
MRNWIAINVSTALGSHKQGLYLSRVPSRARRWLRIDASELLDPQYREKTLDTASIIRQHRRLRRLRQQKRHHPELLPLLRRALLHPRNRGQSLLP